MSLKEFFLVHFDLPTAIILIIIFGWVCWRGLKSILDFCGFSKPKIFNYISKSELIKDVVINLTSIAIIAVFGYFLYQLKSKTYYVGEFTAFENSEDTRYKEVEWGTVVLTYNLFSNNIRGILKSYQGDIVIEIDASLEREIYLKGTYKEVSKLSRLRLGAFLMKLDSNGDSYNGDFLLISPFNNADSIKKGDVRWVRKK